MMLSKILASMILILAATTVFAGISIPPARNNTPIPNGIQNLQNGSDFSLPNVMQFFSNTDQNTVFQVQAVDSQSLPVNGNLGISFAKNQATCSGTCDLTGNITTKQLGVYTLTVTASNPEVTQAATLSIPTQISAKSITITIGCPSIPVVNAAYIKASNNSTAGTSIDVTAASIGSDGQLYDFSGSFPGKYTENNATNGFNVQRDGTVNSTNTPYCTYTSKNQSSIKFTLTPPSNLPKDHTIKLNYLNNLNGETKNNSIDLVNCSQGTNGGCVLYWSMPTPNNQTTPKSQ